MVARVPTRFATELSRNVRPVESAFDIVVIGSGPAGQKAAIQAAKLRKRVAVVERAETLGGVCVNTGTIPSKTIREAILYLTGLDQRGIYGQGYRLRDQIEASDLMQRTLQVVERERNVVRDQLLRNHVQLVGGSARFVDGRTVVVVDAVGARTVPRRRDVRDRDRLDSGARPRRRVQRSDDLRFRHDPAAPLGSPTRSSSSARA